MPVGYPAEVQDAVHRAVGDLGCPLVVEQVQGLERKAGDGRPRRRVAQVVRHTFPQGAHAGADPAPVAVETQQRPDLPSQREQRADDQRARAVSSAPREALHEIAEVACAAGRRQRPHVLDPKVCCQLVDAPGAGGVG